MPLERGKAMSDPLAPEYYDTEASHAEAAEDCPHTETEYDPGNYIPPFGWEQYPALICLACGEEIEQEEPDYGDPPEDWDRDPRDYEPPTPEELADEARNPL